MTDDDIRPSIEDPLAQGPQPGLGAFSVFAELQSDVKKASRNGLTYELKFEVQPGNADAIADLFTGDAPRIWWKPEGANSNTVISRGARMSRFTISLSTSDEAERHDTVILRLTAGDIGVGIGVLQGPWTTPGAGAPVPGLLTIEPMQQSLGI